jgi:hypothetical protein
MPKRATGWSREFDGPIALPGGAKLVTLRDAASYLAALPKKEADAAEWQAAIEAPMLVVELGGSTMFARIGVMQALNRGHVREFNPTRKDPHWSGKNQEGSMTGVAKDGLPFATGLKSREKRKPVATLYAIRFRGYVAQFTQGKDVHGGAVQVHD